MFYKYIIRPLFFKIDPEKIHVIVAKGLGLVSRIKIFNWLLSKFFKLGSEKLKVHLGSWKLENPIGLAAGFDKYIDAPLAYSMIGFGFAELGSITYEEQSGNPKPRLWRIPKDNGLIVNYGLSNAGAEKTIQELAGLKHAVPLGISIAPTTSLELAKMTEDYLKTFLALQQFADYVTLNVSCPNVASCEQFAQVSFIKELAEAVRQKMDLENIKKDIYFKIGPHFSHQELDEVIETCLANKITGLVISNLIKDRSGVKFKSNPEELTHSGGISGALLKDKSNEIISYVYQRSAGKLKIIGVGGIFTADDAYAKIKAGATAVQLITGWIYGGPLVIKKINKELIKLLNKDGYNNINDVVGTLDIKNV